MINVNWILFWTMLVFVAAMHYMNDYIVACAMGVC